MNKQIKELLQTYEQKSINVDKTIRNLIFCWTSSIAIPFCLFCIALGFTILTSVPILAKISFLVSCCVFIYVIYKYLEAYSVNYTKTVAIYFNSILKEWKADLLLLKSFEIVTTDDTICFEVPITDKSTFSAVADMVTLKSVKDKMMEKVHAYLKLIQPIIQLSGGINEK